MQTKKQHSPLEFKVTKLTFSKLFFKEQINLLVRIFITAYNCFLFIFKRQ